MVHHRAMRHSNCMLFVITNRCIAVLCDHIDTVEVRSSTLTVLMRDGASQSNAPQQLHAVCDH
jgi:hypothetical protein